MIFPIQWSMIAEIYWNADEKLIWINNDRKNNICRDVQFANSMSLWCREQSPWPHYMLSQLLLFIAGRGPLSLFWQWHYAAVKNLSFTYPEHCVLSFLIVSLLVEAVSLLIVFCKLLRRSVGVTDSLIYNTTTVQRCHGMQLTFWKSLGDVWRCYTVYTSCLKVL